MCPVARLPTFPGGGPIRRPDALEQAGPRNIVASRFFISRRIRTLITSTRRANIDDHSRLIKTRIDRQLSKWQAVKQGR